MKKPHDPQKKKPIHIDVTDEELNHKLNVDDKGFTAEESPGIIGLDADELLNDEQHAINHRNSLEITDTDLLNIDIDDLSGHSNIHNSLVYVYRSPRMMSPLPEGEVEIPRPPAAPSKPEINWFIDISMPIGMMMAGLIMTLFWGYVYSLMFIVPMASIQLIIAIKRNRSQLKKYEENNNKRINNFNKALKAVWNDLNKIKEKYQDILLDKHIDLDECRRRVLTRDRRLWERAPEHDDFLLLRLGIGVLPFPVNVKYPSQEITIEDDPLMRKAIKSEEQFSIVEDVPICLPLLEGGSAGIIGERHSVLVSVRALLTQLVVQHSYEDVKIVAIYNEHEQNRWSWLNDLQHLSDNRSANCFACGKKQSRELLTALNDLIKKREMNSESHHESEKQVELPYYVFVIADRELVENEPIMRFLMNNNQSLGICSLFLFDQIELLPSNCSYIVNVNKNQGQLLNRISSSQTTAFIPDKISIAQANQIAKGLAPLRMQQLYPEENIPERVSLLELLGLNKVEDLNIREKWSNSKAYNSLSALVGVKTNNEQVHLDIHDRYHGPHGLVAGTTGSGKSELLQTLILSLAVNYHPHDINFVLIDYKGGGMANVFKKLPHLAGIITNLEGNQATRALLSVKSELHRRQSLFDQVNVNHIDKYIKLTKEGRTEQAMPHLVIIVDEFAELKSEQPDFMRELVSTARVGRSLGVHLILATQKPAGIVDEQIWGNARFKICLKVQSSEDSQEVLKRADASKITLPGRAYLQIGNNEVYELFQSAYSGVRYEHPLTQAQPAGPITIDLENTLELHSRDFGGGQPAGDSPSELNALVQYMYDTAGTIGIEQLKGQWLPPLPDKVYLSELMSGSYGWDGSSWKECAFWLEPIVGLVDNPAAQDQYPLIINLGRDGHLAVYGSPGSGKTTFVQTILTSLVAMHSPEDMNIYILDFGGRTLNNFASLPHVGGVIMVDDEEKLKRLMKMLLKELDNRKRLFAERSVSNLQAYRDIAKIKMPALVVAVDNYPALSELYPDAEDFFQQISREGGNLGIHLILSSGGVTSIQYKIVSNIKQALTFQLSDAGDYSTVVGRTEGLEPEPFVGRGLIKNNPPLEFQTAFAVKGETESDRAIALNSLFQDMSIKWQGKRAKPIPVIPEILKQKDLFSDERVIGVVKDAPLKIALGLDTNELEPAYLDLQETPHILVAGKLKCGKTTTLKSLINALTERFNPEELKIYLVDSFSMGLYSIRKQPYIAGYAGNQPQLTDMVDSLVKDIEVQRTALEEARTANDSEEHIDESAILDNLPRLVMLIDDFNDFMQMAEPGVKDTIEKLISRERSIKFHLFTAGITNDIGSNWDQLAKVMKDLQVGLLLGDAMEQQVFNIRVAYSEAGHPHQIGEGYLVNRGQHKKIKIAMI